MRNVTSIVIAVVWMSIALAIEHLRLVLIDVEKNVYVEICHITGTAFLVIGLLSANPVEYTSLLRFEAAISSLISPFTSARTRLEPSLTR